MQEGKSVFEKGIQPQLKFKFDIRPDAEVVTLDYDSSEQLASVKDTLLSAKA